MKGSMNRLAKAPIRISGRYVFLLSIFTCMLTLVVGRLVYLHVIQHDFLRTQGEARTLREITVAAYRGMIKDRNGESLAISTPVDSIWVNPLELDLRNAKLKQFAKLLDMTSIEVKNKVARYAQLKREFLYLRRHVDPKVGKKIRNLHIAGVYVLSEYRRYYPAGEVTSQMLGLTNLDDQGVEGLELAYNDWLQGKPGKKLVERDRLGRVVESLGNLVEVQPGKDLNISVDTRLQYLAYKALKSAVAQHNARSGSAVVLDVKTGEILAMVNDPSFNPNQRARGENIELHRNLAVTDAFEPGSVLKTFSLASVMERTKITPATLVDTQPGYLKLPGGVVRDPHNNGIMEVASILKESSNMGITKLVLNLQPRDLWNTYDRLGFGWQTGSGFPGESAGALPLPRKDQTFVMATMAFGYGVAVTPLQLAQAYAIIGAGGIRRPVSFVKVVGETQGERVLKPVVARQILDMLSIAVEHDRSYARVSGYRVAGKTGTAHIAGKDGYVRDRYRAVFGGLAPAINPRVAIVVTINEPRAGEYYGNQVAAPVFARIASGALRLFKIAPDLLDTQGVHVAQRTNN